MIWGELPGDGGSTRNILADGSARGRRAVLDDWEGLVDVFGRPVRGDRASVQHSANLQWPKLPHYTWPAPEDIPTLRFLQGHWFLRGAVTLIAAPGGVGKTSFIAAALLAMASGRPLLGKPIYSGPVAVCLWNLEDDHEQLARQLSAAALAHDVTAQDCGDRLFVVSGLGGLGMHPEPLVTATQDGEGFRLNEEAFALVEEAVQREGISLLVVDPFVSSHHARENETEVIDRIVKRWSLLAKRCDCSVVLVHHTRKTNGEKADIDSVRGSIAGVNAARAVLLLNRMTETEAAAFGLADDERRRMFSVDLGKANRSAPEAIEWYRLRSIPLGNGGEEPGDEVGAVVPWSPPSAAGELTQMQLEMARAAVANGNHRADMRSKYWVGHVLGAALGIDSHGREGAARLQMIVRAWRDEGKLAVERRRDEGARKEFEFVVLGPAQWLGAGQ